MVRFAGDGLSALLPFIVSRPPTLIMVLGAYFDESIRDRQGAEPLSVAGYVFRPAAYKGFCKAWKRVLESGGPTPTTHFHMTHLYARTYEYEGWSAVERANYLQAAVDAVNRYMLCGISVKFNQGEFERVAPPEWALRFGSIYGVACQVSLRVTTFWMDKNKIDIPTAYIFESGHQFWDEANGILAATGLNEDLKRTYRYHSHTAMDKMQSFGLQAADMFAWLVTRLEVGIPKNHTMQAFAPVVLSLVRGRAKQYQMFHPEGELLHRFIKEQVGSTSAAIATFRKPRKIALR